MSNKVGVEHQPVKFCLQLGICKPETKSDRADCRMQSSNLNFVAETKKPKQLAGVIK